MINIYDAKDQLLIPGKLYELSLQENETGFFIDCSIELWKDMSIESRRQIASKANVQRLDNTWMTIMFIDSYLVKAGMYINYKEMKFLHYNKVGYCFVSNKQEFNNIWKLHRLS